VVIDRFAAARRDHRLAVLEGFHPLKHALRFGAGIIEVVAPDPDAVIRLAERLAPDVVNLVREAIAPVSSDVFARLVPQAPDAGVAGLALRPRVDPGEILGVAGRIVFLDHPNHLGNVGAVVRVAAAAGAAGVLTSGDRDPWHSTAIRGSAGLHFAVPVARVEAIPATPRPIIALDPDGSPLEPGIIPPDALLAFGSERHGLSRRVLDRAGLRVAIPMRPGVSSLNLATSVAVALYVP
jgi:TrmH family RNA methyltransferase